MMTFLETVMTVFFHLVMSFHLFALVPAEMMILVLIAFTMFVFPMVEGNVFRLIILFIVTT